MFPYRADTSLVSYGVFRHVLSHRENASPPRRSGLEHQGLNKKIRVLSNHQRPAYRQPRKTGVTCLSRFRGNQQQHVTPAHDRSINKAKPGSSCTHIANEYHTPPPSKASSSCSRRHLLASMSNTSLVLPTRVHPELNVVCISPETLLYSSSFTHHQTGI